MLIVRNKDIRPRKRAPFRARALRTSAEVTTRHMTTHFYISAIHGGLIRTLPVDFRCGERLNPDLGIHVLDVRDARAHDYGPMLRS